jgi:methyltransferase (TIGR00027 family)
MGSLGTVTDASQTALTAAAARAAHLLVDARPHIFADPLAGALLGDDAEILLRYHLEHGDHLVLAGARAQVVIRSRVTEDRLAEAVGRGVEQYVVLGAGLDSFAYRSPLAARVRVFEVDHPGTQRDKRSRLASGGVAEPPSVRFVPVDLERQPLVGALLAAGFDPARPALVSWLGVTMYLTREAVRQTLSVFAGFAPGTEVVFDYMLPAPLRDEAGEAYVEQVGAVAAHRGEPWLSFFAPDEVADLLAAAGFGAVQQAGQRESLPDRLWRRADVLRPMALSMIAHAVAQEPAAPGPGG